MDTLNSKRQETHQDTVKDGDRGAMGLAIWLVIAVIALVAVSQFTPLKRYLVAEPPQAVIPAPPMPAPTPPPPAMPPPQPVAAPVLESAAPPAPVSEVVETPEQVLTLLPKPVVKPGKEGLVEGLRSGQLRLANGSDITSWSARWSAANGRGLPVSFNEQIQHMDRYVIQRDFTIPDGLAGANSVIFLLEKRVPFPQGDPGHSVILDMSTGACMGVVCGMMLDRD